MNDDERADLEAWTEQLATALGLKELHPDVEQILNLAGDAARAVLRPAAPVSTFLVGYAAGVAAAAGRAPEEAIREASATAVALAKAR